MVSRKRFAAFPCAGEGGGRGKKSEPEIAILWRLNSSGSTAVGDSFVCVKDRLTRKMGSCIGNEQAYRRKASSRRREEEKKATANFDQVSFIFF